MSDRNATHASFTLERHYPVPPARVFAAFADPVKKARWFGVNDQLTLLESHSDFREGGRDRLSGRWRTGMVSTFDAQYHDIVPERRIVYSYVMHLDERRISVSLATLEFLAEAAGTRLVVTEQGAFLDGYDDAGSRERGTSDLLERMGASLLE